MAKVLGKNAVFKFNLVDLSAFVVDGRFAPSGDSHDVTTWGKAAHVYEGGLTDGTLDVNGLYDDAAAGPRATLVPLVGQVKAFVWQPAGTGSGKPQTTGNALLLGYEEAAPVAGFVTWTARFQCSDTLTNANQV